MVHKEDEVQENPQKEVKKGQTALQFHEAELDSKNVLFNGRYTDEKKRFHSRELREMCFMHRPQAVGMDIPLNARVKNRSISYIPYINIQ